MLLVNFYKILELPAQMKHDYYWEFKTIPVQGSIYRQLRCLSWLLPVAVGFAVSYSKKLIPKGIGKTFVYRLVH